MNKMEGIEQEKLSTAVEVLSATMKQQFAHLNDELKEIKSSFLALEKNYVTHTQLDNAKLTLRNEMQVTKAELHEGIKTVAAEITNVDNRYALTKSIVYTMMGIIATSVLVALLALVIINSK